MALEGNLTAQAQMILLVFFRVAPVITFSSLFGGQTVPRRLRTGLSIVLAICLSLGMDRPAEPWAWTTWFMLAAREFVLGLTIAVFVTIVIETFTSAGALVDLFRGVTLSGTVNPLVGVQQSPLGPFLQQLAIVLFLTLGGYRLLIDALTGAFVYAPIGGPLPAVGTALASSDLPRLAGALFLISVQIAAPVALLCFAIDVWVALTGRFIGQLDAASIAMDFKPFAGLGIFLLTIGLIAGRVPELLAWALRVASTWVRAGG